MKVEMWKLSDVKPYEQNPRINDPAVDAVAEAIREYGFRQPIVVDADGVNDVAACARERHSKRFGNIARRVSLFDRPLPAAPRAIQLARADGTQVHPETLRA